MTRPSAGHLDRCRGKARLSEVLRRRKEQDLSGSASEGRASPFPPRLWSTHTRPARPLRRWVWLTTCRRVASTLRGAANRGGWFRLSMSKSSNRERTLCACCRVINNGPINSSSSSQYPSAKLRWRGQMHVAAIRPVELPTTTQALARSRSIELGLSPRQVGSDCPARVRRSGSRGRWPA